MKKEYFTPNIEVVELDVEQIISASGASVVDEVANEDGRSSEFRNNLWN